MLSHTADRTALLIQKANSMLLQKLINGLNGHRGLLVLPHVVQEQNKEVDFAWKALRANHVPKPEKSRSKDAKLPNVMVSYKIHSWVRGNKFVSNFSV